MNALSAGGPRYFLVVDADPIARTQVHGFLTGQGHQLVLEAPSIKEALELMNQHPVAGLVVDWDTPDAGGYALLKLIRGQTRYQDVLFVMMSDPDADAQTKIVKSGSLKVDGFLLKPFNSSSLGAILQKPKKF